MRVTYAKHMKSAINDDFYRIISMFIIAARCYANAAYVVMQCLSVCLFKLSHSVKTTKHILKKFSPSGNQAILFFSVLKA